MIENIVRKFINEQTNISAYMEKPEEPPEEYFLIEKTGSRNAEFIFTSTLAIDSVASSLYNAAVANEELKNVMDKLIYLDLITKVVLRGDYNASDPERREYKYQAIFDISHY